MSAAELLALADRCEAAIGGDRELDVAISTAVTTFEPRRAGPGWPDENALVVPAFPGWEPLPAYTASLDAAMTLVLEDAHRLRFWRIGNDGEGGDPSAFKAEILAVTNLTSTTSKAIGATPALALCAAALKSLAAQEQSQ